MDIPVRIQQAAERLKASKRRRSNRITVRDFLQHFGVSRRGANKVQDIRDILEQLGLETEPDFEEVWIDAPIQLKLKDGLLLDPAHTAEPSASEAEPDDDQPEDIILEGSPSAVIAAEELTEQAPVSPDNLPIEAPALADTGAPTDPTFRIGNLPAANKKLISVNINDPLSRAVTLMLQYAISQVPIMQGEREVKGMVTWKSIARRLSLGGPGAMVAECREEARIVDSNRNVFDVIPTIVEHGYVLVRGGGRITGIVAASDLSLWFHNLGEPFLLLREIEFHVRNILRNRLTKSDLKNCAAEMPDRHVDSIDDLTFGEYVRLIQNNDIWRKLDLKLDRQVLAGLLEEVRRVRNDVFHFDPDPLEDSEVETLKRAARLLQELHETVSRPGPERKGMEQAHAQPLNTPSVLKATS